MCVFDYQRLTLSVPFEERATAHPSRIREQELKGNRDFRATKLAKFSGLQAQVVPAARKNALKRSLQPHVMLLPHTAYSCSMLLLV